MLQIYQAAKLNSSDRVITLDHAPLPFESAPERKKKILQTIENFKIMKKRNDQTTMTVHGFTKKEIELSLGACTGENFISFPSYFTLLVNRKRKNEFGEMVKIAPAEDLNLLPESKKFMLKYYPAASPS
ncbi:MAG: hypothetical protein ACTSVZ_13015, partial [Promethearchaeota archaeon]